MRAPCFNQEPRSAFGLVNPGLEIVSRLKVPVHVANIAGGAQERSDLSVVAGEFGQHLGRRKEIGIVVGKPLQPSDVTNGVQRGASELAYTFRDDIRDRKYLLGLLVEHRLEATKTRCGHVPMETLRLEIKRK